MSPTTYNRLARTMGFLPTPLRVLMAWKMAVLMMVFGQKRVKILRQNWQRCGKALFPDGRSLSVFQVAFYHAMALLDFLAWLHLPPEELSKNFVVEGSHHLETPNLLIYAPHFVGLALTTRYLAACHATTFLYNPSKRADVAVWMDEVYQRLSQGRAHRKTDSILPIARALKRGEPVQLSTDLDVGRRDTIFVPFCGNPAATSPAIPVFAKKFSAVVLGVCCYYTPPTLFEQTHRWWRNAPSPRYRLVCEPINLAWQSISPLAAQTQLHVWLEGKIRQHPLQYWWFHKRFKTEPPTPTPEG